MIGALASPVAASVKINGLIAPAPSTGRTMVRLVCDCNSQASCHVSVSAGIIATADFLFALEVIGAVFTLRDTAIFESRSGESEVIILSESEV